MFHRCVDVFVTNALRRYFFKDLPLTMDAHDYMDEYRASQDEVLQAVKYPYRLDHPLREHEKEPLSASLAAPAVVLSSSREDKKRTQQHAQVEALLALLTPKQREVIALHFGLSEENGETWDFKAISQHLGLEKSTAFHRWQRAVRKLQAVGAGNVSPDLHSSVSCR
jgi:DNA-directed RNA polymerase sigma subunit (sigma70/sigma32)